MRNTKMKLTDEQVENMLCEIYAGVYDSTHQISEKYNISDGLIRRILNYKSYTHVLDNLKIPLQEIKLKLIKPKIINFHSLDDIEQILKDVMNKKYLSKYEIIRKYKLQNDTWLYNLFHDSVNFYKLKNRLGFNAKDLKKAYSLINLESVKLGKIYNSLDDRSDLLIDDLNNIFERIYIKKDNLQDIANDFGFTKSHIRSIKNCKVWKNYPRPTIN